MKRLLLVLLIAALALFALGCPKKKDGASADPSGGSSVVVKQDSAGLLLIWIDAKGDFHTEQKVADVPLEGRDAVRVIDPDKDEGTSSDKIFVADLRQAGADGTYPVKTMTRAEFEQLAVARRAQHGPTLASAGPPPPNPTGANPPPLPPTNAVPTPPPGSAAANVTPVIIYGAAWCGPCRQAQAYLNKRGIPFVEHDIDEEPGAVREMKQKLSRAGIPYRGQIPVIDVRGKMIVGFSEESLDDALGHAL